MFGWICDWLVRWATNRSRAVFRFWDGRRARRVDPFVVLRRLHEHPLFDWQHDPGAIDDLLAMGRGEQVDVPMSVDEFFDTTERVSTVVRSAFGIPEYDGRAGLTEGECVKLLGDFGGYVDVVKKNTSSRAILPSRTARPHSDPCHTNNGSGCGSTPRGQR